MSGTTSSERERLISHYEGLVRNYDARVSQLIEEAGACNACKTKVQQERALFEEYGEIARQTLKALRT